MGADLKDGDEVLLKGSAGALFRVTIGPAFTAADVTARLRTGEWSYPDTHAEPSEPVTPGPDTPPAAPEPEVPQAGGDPKRPGANDPKSAWITYVAGLKHMTIEDASSYTKADLIEMAD